MLNLFSGLSWVVEDIHRAALDLCVEDVIHPLAMGVFNFNVRGVFG